MSISNRCHLGTWVILSQRQLRPCGLKRNIGPSVRYLGKWKRGSFQEENNCQGPLLSEWPTLNHSTPALLLILRVCLLPLEAQVPDHFLAQEGIYIHSSSYPFVFEPLGYVGFPYVWSYICFSPVITLPRVNLIIDHLRESLRSRWNLFLANSTILLLPEVIPSFSEFFTNIFLPCWDFLKELGSSIFWNTEHHFSITSHLLNGRYAA